MDWSQVRAVFPNQIVLIEALEIINVGVIRKILGMSVVSLHNDSSVAWKAYKSIHTQYPNKEFYIFHTNRENIDVIDQNVVRNKTLFFISFIVVSSLIYLGLSIKYL